MDDHLRLMAASDELAVQAVPAAARLIDELQQSTAVTLTEF
jgi:hypothetical protein